MGAEPVSERNHCDWLYSLSGARGEKQKKEQKSPWACGFSIHNFWIVFFLCSDVFKVQFCGRDTDDVFSKKKYHTDKPTHVHNTKIFFSFFSHPFHLLSRNSKKSSLKRGDFLLLFLLYSPCLPEVLRWQSQSPWTLLVQCDTVAWFLRSECNELSVLQMNRQTTTN